jgi:hypothetical protein
MLVLSELGQLQRVTVASNLNRLFLMVIHLNVCYCSTFKILSTILLQIHSTVVLVRSESSGLD